MNTHPKWVRFCAQHQGWERGAAEHEKTPMQLRASRFGGKSSQARKTRLYWRIFRVQMEGWRWKAFEHDKTPMWGVFSCSKAAEHRKHARVGMFLMLSGQGAWSVVDGLETLWGNRTFTDKDV